MHTHPYSLTYTLVSAHCFPPRNITGIAIAPVGTIYRSNTVKFLQISDPDLQLALHPAGISHTLKSQTPPHPPQLQPPSSYLWHPPQPRSPSYSHYGQSCLCRDKLQHGGQRSPSCARGPLLFINQTLQGPRRQQLTQLGQYCLRTTVIHLRDEDRQREKESGSVCLDFALLTKKVSVVFMACLAPHTSCGQGAELPAHSAGPIHTAAMCCLFS